MTNEDLLDDDLLSDEDIIGSLRDEIKLIDSKKPFNIEINLENFKTKSELSDNISVVPWTSRVSTEQDINTNSRRISIKNVIKHIYKELLYSL